MPKVKKQDLENIGFEPGAGNGWYLDYGDKKEQTHLHLRVKGSDWNGGFEIDGITVKIRDQQAGEIGYSVLSGFTKWRLQGITDHPEAVELFSRAIDELNRALIK